MTFHGPSAQGVRDLSNKLREILGEGGDPTRLGDDLFEVSQLLRSEGGLRRFATDPSVTDETKYDLVTQLFEGRVELGTLDLLKTAFTSRWSRPRDLADAVERTSEESVVRSAPDSERLADELFEVRRIVEDNPGLRDALSDPGRSVEDKAGLVEDLLGDRALPATVTLTKQALAGTYRTVSAALEQYEKVTAAVHGQRVATVRVARPLGERDQERLRQALSRQYDRDVHLNVVVDPGIVGGIRVEIGDDVIDGSVSSRLDDARRKLAG